MKRRAPIIRHRRAAAAVPRRKANPAPVGYVIVSEAGRLVEANLTASSLLGMSELKKEINGLCVRAGEAPRYRMEDGS